MGFGILLVVVLLIILLAFLGVFGKFPDSWAWIGIVLAIVGIITTVPTIFQIIWGRPKVRTQFEVYYENLHRMLVIYLNNPPLAKRMWRFIGVRRDTVQSLTGEFQISEIGTNKIIVPIRHARIFTDDDPTDLGKDRIVLPPTFSVGACITVAYWDETKNEVKIMQDRIRPLIPISPGYYQIKIIFFIDGLPKEIIRKFVVGNKPDDLIWVNAK